MDRLHQITILLVIGDTHRDTPAKKTFRDNLPRNSSDEGRAFPRKQKRYSEDNRSSCSRVKQLLLVSYGTSDLVQSCHGEWYGHRRDPQNYCQPQADERQRWRVLIFYDACHMNNR